MRDTVLKVLSEVLGVPGEELTEQTRADDVAAWTSLQHMKLIFALEEEFRIQFSDEDIVAMLDVGRIVSKVEQLA